MNLYDWLHNPPYTHGTIKEELQCYGLPYGGIGFASHILTYYTIIMLSYQRAPWWPWKKNNHKHVDAILAFIGMIATIILSILTILRCRNRWQFIAMASWKMVLSITLGCLSFHAALLIQPKYHSLNRAEKEVRKVLWWLLLYAPGVVAGLTGLLSLVMQEIRHNRDLQIITAVFGSIVAFLALLWLIIALCTVVGNSAEENKVQVGFIVTTTFLMVAFSATGVLAAFYSDWVLGAMAENLAGVPSGDVAPLYWAYFIAKRLPFFSF